MRFQSVILVAAALSGTALAGDVDFFRANRFTTRLTGFRENPVHITNGSGEFRARVNADGTRVDFELVFRNLTGPATGSHIHVGAPWTNGPIVVHFCGTGGKPPCPAEGVILRGSFTADDVQASPENNLAAGDLAGLLRAMRAGVTYVNVHSEMFPAGEIRGQLRRIRFFDEDFGLDEDSSASDSGQD